MTKETTKKSDKKTKKPTKKPTKKTTAKKATKKATKKPVKKAAKKAVKKPAKKADKPKTQSAEKKAAKKDSVVQAPLVTIEQLAQSLGMPVLKIKQLHRTGKIKGVKIDGKWMFNQRVVYQTLGRKSRGR